MLKKACQAERMNCSLNCLKMYSVGLFERFLQNVFYQNRT